MFCTTCGASNPDDGRFCQKCRNVLPVLGAPMTTPPPRNANAGMTAMPKPGISAASTFAGRFQVLSILGKGGMGVVYKARDLELGEELAIKVLQAQFANDPNEVARFKRELVTARKITHPNVIRIHDFGIADGEAFISMEALPGGTLADRIAKGVSIAEGVAISIGICEGLAAAHAKDVVHRDIKPHNVLFDEAGIPKLVDFGIARLANATSRTVGYAGTPHYMSPEQARGAEATRLSDIYALGVLLFELFTGRLPFQADSLVGLAMMHANDPPPPPRTVRPELPEDVEKVILRALAKEPSARWQSAREIADALRAPTTATGPMPRALTPPPPPPPPVAPRPSDRTPAPIDERAERARSGGERAIAAPRPSAPPPKRTSSVTIVAIAILLGAPLAIGLAILALIDQRQQRQVQEAADLDFAFPQETPTIPIAVLGQPQRRTVGGCTYLAPAGWSRAEDFEEGFFDEAWQQSTRIVAVGWDESADLDDLSQTITELSEEDDLALEKLVRKPDRIVAQLRSTDGVLRGSVIAIACESGGVIVAGIAPASEISGARTAAEKVASSLVCASP